MAANSNSKRHKAEEQNDGIDRISSLPNSLLCYILSFLPTKTCVSTMTLVSRRFRNLWKDLQTFDFCDNYGFEGYENEDYDDENIKEFMLFAIFVNAVLALRRSRDIRKMSLSCIHHQRTTVAYSVNTWIRTAIGPHLEEFRLIVCCIDGLSFNLPLTLLSCANLVSLCLGGDILFQLQDSSGICLHSLKVLQLLEIHHLDVNSVHILFSGCPILENLELSFFPESFARLCVPSYLKRLIISVENQVEACLEINAPGPKHLSLTNITFGNAVGNLYNLEEAYLGVDSSPKSESVDPLLNLLRPLSGVKRLELHCSTTEWLFDAPFLHIPEFCHLFHLEVFLPSFNLKFLFDTLEKCPMLQTLMINHRKDHSLVTDDSSHSYGWLVKPKTVPKCLVFHLTFIHFRAYQGNIHELEFTSNVLQNGLVLKTMLICDSWLKQPKKWKEIISDIPRGSAMCQLEFY